MAAVVLRQRELLPTPISHGSRENLQLPRWSVVTNNGFPFHHDADRPPLLRDHSIRLYLRSCQLLLGQCYLVLFVHIASNFERPVLPHVLQWRQTLLFRGLGEPGHGVLKNPSVIFIDGELLSWPVRRFKILPIPIEPSGSIAHDKLIQNSSSSQTAPGFA